MLSFNEFVKTIDATEIMNEVKLSTNSLDSEPEKSVAISYATTIALIERYHKWCSEQ